MVLVRTPFEYTVLRSLNVSKNFQTSVGSANYIRMEEVPGTIAPVSNAVFFPTESGFDLTFGDWQPYNSTIYGNRSAPIVDRKWRYEIATRQWTNMGITVINWFQRNAPRQLSSSMTAWIPSLKKGFLFGGTLISANELSLSVQDLEEHPGLVTYDQATERWTNETTPLGGISEGGLVHITTATDEVLIQFGGSTNRSKWYTQHLPRDAGVPDPRFAFCTALKSASDGSSHQIYIMGGVEPHSSVDARGGPTATSLWVLSIPSLEWVQLPVTSKAVAANPGRRISPKCLAIGEHYIFYYGGRKAMDYSGTVTCDKRAKATFLFDVNTLSWTDEFTPNEGKYEIPPTVVDVIGGDKNGGSTKKAPAKGWNDPDLETVMTLKTITTATTSADRSGSSSGSSKTKVGAIAGGTVAGVVLAALGLLGARMLYRDRQNGKSQNPPASGTRAGPAELA
ncbi:hypothetical protein HOY80DRAFT_1102574 [Tuber brumale]|nr:hypothetical protein HOY80DRAFT_1102574 [Tuber brumale]